MWWDKYYTGVKVVIKNHCFGQEVKKVYDAGNGAYLKSHVFNTPRYMTKDGSFTDPNYYQCNGDAISWQPHIGDVTTLKFQRKVGT